MAQAKKLLNEKHNEVINQNEGSDNLSDSVMSSTVSSLTTASRKRDRMNKKSELPEIRNPKKSKAGKKIIVEKHH